ncbi:MAG: DUF2125 domain-containing protein [Pseudomonadota bacterium]
MRWLVILVTVAALAWSGWWWLGASALERGLDAAVTAARSDGWQIDYEGASVRGFPNRFDTTLTDVTITPPDGSITWQGPFLQALALSYRPNHVIAVAPPEQRLSLPDGTVDIRSDDLRGSAIFSASAEPVLRRATIVADTLTVEGAGLRASMAAGQLALREAEAPAAYDVAASLSDLDLGDAVGLQPGIIDRIDVDSTLQLDAPITVTGTTPPSPTEIQVRRAEIAWSDALLSATGTLRLDHLGRPSGDLLLEADGWQSLFDTLQQEGLIPSDQAPLLRAGLEGMAVDGRVEIPITIDAGQIRIGAIPLGIDLGAWQRR